MKVSLGLFALVLFGSMTLGLDGADWPQYRGPHRDGVSRETGLLKEWPTDGPRLLWTYEKAGVGYSGPAIVGDRLYLMGGRDGTEYVYALDLKDSPKEVWATRIGPLFQWKGNTWNAGPSSTPTVDGDLIFTLGGQGELVCVDAATGKERWRKNLPRELGGEVNPIGGGLEDPTPLGWGYTWSPLVDGEKLICIPGGRQGLMAALDKRTGKVLWQTREVTDQATYSSPLVIEVGGIKQYVQVTNAGIVGVAAETGKQLWYYRRAEPYADVVISTPIFHDNHVFATVGFEQGCDLIKLSPTGSGTRVDRVYSNKSMENRDGGVVLIGDHLYGHSENAGWVCQEFKTGKIVWSERNQLGRGSLASAEGLLYCCSEKEGIILLVEASPKGWTVKGKLKLPRVSRQRKPSGGLWTHPVIANGRLYVRDQELLFCYDLRP